MVILVWVFCLVELRGLEPLTPCLQNSPDPSPDVSARVPDCRLAGQLTLQTPPDSPGHFAGWLPDLAPGRARIPSCLSSRDRF